MKKEKSSNSVKYAGFWVRFLAMVLDCILLGAVSTILSGGNNDIQGSISLAVGWLYFAFMESSVKQATLGKMVLGLKVTDINGKKISFARATGRYFAKILSAIILFIGFIMVAFTEKKQGLHDKLADTLVVRK